MRHIIIALGLLLSLSSVSYAFTLVTTNSNQLGWSNSEVRFMINTSNCPAGVDVVGAFKEAADVWNGVPTSALKVSYGGTTTSSTFASPPTVYCETNFQTVTGLNQNFVVGAGAITTSGNRPATGVLILNASVGTGNIANIPASRMKIIMAHEIGHVLGLGHADESLALMYFDASSKTTLGLSQDDIDGISYLYPRDELGADPKMGCGLVTTLPPAAPPWGGLFVGFSSVITAWWVLRRHRTQSGFAS